MSNVERVRPQRKVYETAYWPTVAGWKAAEEHLAWQALRNRLGPAPCQKCGVPVYWRGASQGWCEAGNPARHRCA